MHEKKGNEKRKIILKHSSIKLRREGQKTSYLKIIFFKPHHSFTLKLKTSLSIFVFFYFVSSVGIRVVSCRVHFPSSSVLFFLWNE
jgi:hypothetical protein